MTMPSLEICEQYIRGEIARLDTLNIDNKTNAEYFNRNILFYGWLLQRNWLAVRFSELAPLLGVTEPEINSRLNATNDIKRFFAKSTEVALRLHENMEIAIENVFNDPAFNYYITHPVPHFGKITGYELIEYMNLLSEPPSISFPSLVMDAFRAALPGIQMELLYDDFPGIRLVTGQGFEEEWQFVLGVFPHNGLLDDNKVNMNKGVVSDIKDELEDEYGHPHVLIIAPGVDDTGRSSVGRNKYFHFLWGLSTLRFFHLFDKLKAKHKDYQKLLVAGFPKIFEVAHASPVFSIREALDRLDAFVEEKKTEASS